jgi:hypothetical protein
MPTSKARMLAWVTGFEWRPLAAALEAEPQWLDFVDERRRNLLHLCCSVDPARRNLRPADGMRTAQVLLDAGFDIDRPAFTEGAWQATPVWFTVSRGRNLGLTRFLLERGASPEHSLWSAVFNDDRSALALLLGHGANPNVIAENETPLMSAVKRRNHAAAKILLENGADPDFQDDRGRTALHLALRDGDADEKLIRLLLRYGARTDVQARDGTTAAKMLARKRAPALRRLAASLPVLPDVALPAACVTP